MLKESEIIYSPHKIIRSIQLFYHAKLNSVYFNVGTIEGKRYDSFFFFNKGLFFTLIPPCFVFVFLTYHKTDISTLVDVL